MKKVLWVIVFLAVSFITSEIVSVIFIAIFGNSDTVDIIGSVIGFMVPSAATIILCTMWIADLKYGSKK